MPISLKQSAACTRLAEALYDFLPGTGTELGRLTFESVACAAGVGDLWVPTSKRVALSTLLEDTLTQRRRLFQPLMVAIVQASLRYRQKLSKPLTRAEVDALNQAIMAVGFKFPELWSSEFLASLPEQLRTEQVPAEQNPTAVELSPEDVAAASAHQQRYTLQERFYRLFSQSDRQQAGLELERILHELFELSGLSPHSPFRIQGEQIDGSFLLDGDVYLLEAKWTAAPVAVVDLYAFRVKIEGKASFTRGLFLSINGFSAPALQAIVKGKQPNFVLMDGDDLSLVLMGSVSLADLLRAKMRHLAESGEVHLSARSLSPDPARPDPR